MAATTLDDIKERLIREGELNRNDGAHSIKSLKATVEKSSQEIIKAFTGSLEGAVTAVAAAAAVASTDDSVDNEQDNEQQQEDKREQKKQNAIFATIADRIQGLEKFMGDMIDKSTIAGGLVGLAALLFSPDLVVDFAISAVEYFQDLIGSVRSAFDGDWNPMMELIKEHTLGVGLTLAFVIGKLGILSKAMTLMRWGWTLLNSKVMLNALGLIADVSKGAISMLGSALKWLRGAFLAAAIFTNTTLLPALASVSASIVAMAGSMITAITPFLVAAAPFVAAGAAIAAAIYLIVDNWDTIKSTIMEAIQFVSDMIPDSVKQTLTTLWNDITGGMGFIGLITAPIRLVGDWLAEAFGFKAPEGEQGVITAMVKNVWEDVKAWFASILPTMEDIKAIGDKLTPDFLKSDDTPSDLEAMASTNLANMSDDQLKALAAERDTIMTDEDDILEDLIKQREQAQIQQALVNGNLDQLTSDNAEVAAALQPVEKVDTVSSDMLNEQVVNNMLKDLQAANPAPIVMPPPPAPGNTNVSASTVNMTNTVDSDRLAREFAFNPKGGWSLVF